MHVPLYLIFSFLVESLIGGGGGEEGCGGWGDQISRNDWWLVMVEEERLYLKTWNLEYSNTIDKIQHDSEVVNTIQSLKPLLSW